MSSPFTIGSLFAGVGGFDLGFERAGFQTRWCVEVDKHCQTVLHRHFPAASILGNITTVEPADLEPVDVITYGAPCQDLSVAGKREGLLNGKRSNLFFEAIRLIRGLRPTVAIYENVPGLYSSHGGRDFGLVLDALAESGYDVGWVTLDSRWFGVPQRRLRVFTLACDQARTGLAERCVSEILAVREGVSGYSSQGDEAGQGVAGDAPAGAGGAGVCFTQNQHNEVRLVNGDGSITGALPAQPGMNQQAYIAYRDCAAGVGGAVAFEPRFYTRDNKTGGMPSDVAVITNCAKSGDSAPAVAYCPDTANPLGVPSGVPDTAGCLDNGGHGGGFNGQDAYNDRLIVQTAATLRGFGHGWQGQHNDTHAVATYRNQQFGRISEDDLAGTLTMCGPSGSEGGKGASALVQQAVATTDAVVYDCRGNGTGELSPNITGDHQNRVTDYTAVAVQDAVAFEPGSIARNAGPSRPSETVSTQRRDMGDNQPAVLIPASRSIVRRLTPVECERLQGFPDDWTAWGLTADGQRVELSDTQRYRQMGNAVTVNVAEHIARRIKPLLTTDDPADAGDTESDDDTDD